MSEPIEDGGAAFPVTGFGEVIHGMTLRTYAAIKLRVPESGIDWLDDMIRKSLRDSFAGQALAGELASQDEDWQCDTTQALNVARRLQTYADAMLEARKESE